ncbi:MAG: hypothetical protein K6C36_03420 [Clostridia bacterium]|nr:hypothetical protein [Clostridia bacterium]
MKKMISIFLAIIMLALSFPVSAFADDIEATMRHNYGALSDPDEEFMGIIETDEPTRSLPSSVNNTAFFPSPGNQGNQNSCVGWAVAYAMKSGSEYLKRGWTISYSKHQFSPAYIYNQINGGQDDGATIVDALNKMLLKGCCTSTYFPYNENNYTTQPSQNQHANAALYGIGAYTKMVNITQIKNAIASGKGVVIAVKVYPDMENISSTNQIYDSTAGTAPALGHAICLVGYNDNKGSGAFKFINSWDTSWGLNGYGWISYNLVNSSSVNINGAGVGYYITTMADHYVMGDSDSDGVVTSADARKALRYAIGTETPTPTQYALSDVNGDSLVTSSDSNEILSYALGNISTFSLYS